MDYNTYMSTVPAMIISFVLHWGNAAGVHTKQAQLWRLGLRAALFKLFSKTKGYVNVLI